jgi:hypothetical protein
MTTITAFCIGRRNYQQLEVVSSIKNTTGSVVPVLLACTTQGETATSAPGSLLERSSACNTDCKVGITDELLFGEVEEDLSDVELEYGFEACSVLRMLRRRTDFLFATHNRAMHALCGNIMKCCIVCSMFFLALYLVMPTMFIVMFVAQVEYNGTEWVDNGRVDGWLSWSDSRGQMWWSNISDRISRFCDITCVYSDGEPINCSVCGFDEKGFDRCTTDFNWMSQFCSVYHSLTSPVQPIPAQSKCDVDGFSHVSPVLNALETCHSYSCLSSSLWDAACGFLEELSKNWNRTMHSLNGNQDFDPKGERAQHIHVSAAKQRRRRQLAIEIQSQPKPRRSEARRRNRHKRAENGNIYKHGYLVNSCGMQWVWCSWCGVFVLAKSKSEGLGAHKRMHKPVSQDYYASEYAGSASQPVPICSSVPRKTPLIKIDVARSILQKHVGALGKQARAVSDSEYLLSPPSWTSSAPHIPLDQDRESTSTSSGSDKGKAPVQEASGNSSQSVGPIFVGPGCTRPSSDPEYVSTDYSDGDDSDGDSSSGDPVPVRKPGSVKPQRLKDVVCKPVHVVAPEDGVAVLNGGYFDFGWTISYVAVWVHNFIYYVPEQDQRSIIARHVTKNSNNVTFQRVLRMNFGFNLCHIFMSLLLTGMLWVFCVSLGRFGLVGRMAYLVSIRFPLLYVPTFILFLLYQHYRQFGRFWLVSWTQLANVPSLTAAIMIQAYSDDPVVFAQNAGAIIARSQVLNLRSVDMAFYRYSISNILDILRMQMSKGGMENFTFAAVTIGHVGRMVDAF